MTTAHSIVEDAHRLAGETEEARTVYCNTLRAIAEDDPPADAADRIAKAVGRMAETGRTVTPDDTTQHLDFFLIEFEKRAEAEAAQQAFMEHDPIDVLSEAVDAAKESLKQAIEALTQHADVQRAKGQLSAAMLARRGAEDARIRLDQARRKTSSLAYDLRPRDVRIDPRRH